MRNSGPNDPTVIEEGDQAPEDRFASAWRDGAPPPALTEFLPQEGDEGYLATLERLVQIEIDQAWRRWSRSATSTPLPLEDYLQRFPALRTAEAVVRLAQREFAARMNWGDRPDPRSYATRFPDYFTVESALEILEGTPAEDRPDIKLGMLGEYRLLAQIGEGGMGVVYRAIQPGAERIVALKVIRTAIASAGGAYRKQAEDRFRNEIHAAAKLEHENIVPVYDVGSVGDLLYFAMRFVEGQSLHQLVKNGPIESRQAAMYMAGTARGVAEAHARGILHRDLKPHNVLIEARTGRPMVADFGLAKVVDSEDHLTKTGETLGTPSYMPPEQISDAAAVDERGDVYSMGATLYCLLTGRPPFQSANTMGTMRQVLYDEPVPPRRLNSTIDADLETITLKCLQKEPARRYQSALEFLDDVERHLRGEPILARPIGRIERLNRWRRRNPVEAGLTAAAILLAVVALAATTIGYRNTRAALEEAEANLAMAKSAVDGLYTEVSEIDLQDQPGLQPLKERLLLKALAYYRRLLERRDRDATLTAELADSHFRVGAITEEVNSVSEALPHYRTAAEIQRGLLAQSPDDRGLLEKLSDSLNSEGRVTQRLQQFESAQISYDQARELRERLVELAPDDRGYQRKLANIVMNSGLLKVRRNELDGAAADYASAQAIRQSLLDNATDDATARDFARGAFNFGTLDQKREQFAEANSHFKTAITWFRRLVDGHPESLSDRFELAVASSLHGDLLTRQNQHDGALTAYAESRGALSQLISENPKVVGYRERLGTLVIGEAKLHFRLAVEALERQPPTVEKAAEHLALAGSLLTDGSVALSACISSEPGRTGPRYDLAVLCQLLGEVRLAQQDPVGATTAWRQGLAALAPLKSRFAENQDCQLQWDALEEGLKLLEAPTAPM